ncbi:MAG: aminoglycoside phosphotransferase family protein [Dehalococcoidia bacterium]
MSVPPQIPTEALLAGVKSHLGHAGDVRIRKRKPFRMPRGGTGSYFEGVELQIDGENVPAVLKLGRMTGGPPTREALFFGRYSADSPMRTPRCYGVGELSLTRDTWVLMERMPRGKRVSDWTLDETREALCNLASLHAMHLGNVTDDLPRPFTRDLERWLSFVPEGVRQIRSVFDAYPKLPRFASDRALDFLLALCARPEVFREAFARSPQTLLHGDYHRANLVVREGQPQVAYDWQFACFGPPAYDLAVFWNTLGLTTRRGLFGLVDVLEVGERCLSWDEVKDVYSEALRRLRPEAEVDAIFGCSDEALAWEIARQVTYMGPVMAESQADRLRFVYRDHRTIGGLAIRLLGIENVFRLYRTVFAEFEERAERLLKSKSTT